MRPFLQLLQRWIGTRLVFPLFLMGAVAGYADDRDDKLKELEKKYEFLEQKYRDLERRLEGGPASDKSKAASTVSIGASGFSMRSADTNFTLRFRGLVQMDSRSYVDD